MVAARPGRIDAVLVCKLDRFGRSALDLLTNLRELESSGFSLYRIGILVADQLFVSGAGFAPSCHRISKKTAMRLSVSANSSAASESNLYCGLLGVSRCRSLTTAITAANGPAAPCAPRPGS